METHALSLSRKRRRRRSDVSLACWSLLIVAVSGNDHFGNPLLPTLEGDEFDNAIPLRHQRPSGATASSDGNIAADDSTTPKVVLRPRTRIKLEEENAHIPPRDSSPQPVPVAVLHPIHPKKITGTAPSPVALPKDSHVPGTSTRAEDTPPKTTSRNVSTPVSKRPGNATVQHNERRVPGDREKLQISRDESEFLIWCRQVLGITTILEIQSFPYDDFNTQSIKTDWESDMVELGAKNGTNSSGYNQTKSKESTPVTYVRGLAAGRDIDIGETVIRVPLQALFSVAMSIDQDPVLSSVMGPTQRKLHRWEDQTELNNGTEDADDSDVEEAHFYELPLLAVALLHHRRLGSASPIAPYIRILNRSPVDTMPFLWTANKLKESASEGVRIVARGIREEIKTMYEHVVQVLIKTHPELFGQATAIDSVTGEWVFSYKMFQWAFSIVNSRHWQLPIEDLTAAAGVYRQLHHHQAPAPNLQDPVPPAQKPIDTWVKEQGDVDDDTTRKPVASSAPTDDDVEVLPNMYHSFLAPVADLLNFGPPCTRVNYDKTTRAFEIIATCAFTKGQEVTFWYSNECNDVMVGVYGFSHALVPPCKSSEEWRLRADTLEDELKEAYDDLKLLEDELEYVEAKLALCGYDDGKNGHNSRLRHEEHHPPIKTDSTRAPSAKNRNESPRRSRRRNSKESHRVRRTWLKTEF